MLSDVPTRKLDVFYEDGAYILQTTKHPKLNVSEYLNKFPKRTSTELDTTDDAPKIPSGISGISSGIRAGLGSNLGNCY